MLQGVQHNSLCGLRCNRPVKAVCSYCTIYAILAFPAAASVSDVYYVTISSIPCQYCFCWFLVANAVINTVWMFPARISRFKTFKACFAALFSNRNYILSCLLSCVNWKFFSLSVLLSCLREEASLIISQYLSEPSEKDGQIPPSRTRQILSALLFHFSSFNISNNISNNI